MSTIFHCLWSILSTRLPAQQGKTVDSIPEDVMLALGRYNWPGNIRKLQNVIERGVVRTAGRVLSRHTTRRVLRLPGSAGLLPHRLRSPPRDPLVSNVADAERAHITAVLGETNWRVGGPRGAAAQLGVARTTLIGRMRRGSGYRKRDIDQWRRLKDSWERGKASRFFEREDSGTTLQSDRSDGWLTGSAEPS